MNEDEIPSKDYQEEKEEEEEMYSDRKISKY